MSEVNFGGAAFDIEITVLLIRVLFVRGVKKDRSRKTCESVSRCIGRSSPVCTPQFFIAKR